MRRRARFDLSAINEATRWLQSENIELLHSYNSFANTWGRILATLARIPIFITGEHGTVWRTSGFLFHLDKVAQRTAKMTIANSHASATLIQQRYCLPADKITVLYNAVASLPRIDKDEMRRYWGVEGATIVGSVGRLDNPKDYPTLVDAAKRVISQRKDIVFVLVGGGPLENELRDQINVHGIANNFIMTGWRSDAREIMQMFDLFVGTSIRESFGNVFVEAALAGIPVIAPAVDGIPEVVADGETGLLLTPRCQFRPSNSPSATPIGPIAIINQKISKPLSLDPDELAKNILNLLDDRDRLKKYGDIARSRAQLRYGLHRYIMNLNNLYFSLLAS